ncbi:hypothetical protein XENTR_v10018177 [Xenopus tropicalis]|nr:hypothetical protein XENTR_v10018177 [Xenopus tropicalis]
MQNRWYIIILKATGRQSAYLTSTEYSCILYFIIKLLTEKIWTMRFFPLHNCLHFFQNLHCNNCRIKT